MSREIFVDRPTTQGLLRLFGALGRSIDEWRESGAPRELDGDAASRLMRSFLGQVDTGMTAGPAPAETGPAEPRPAEPRPAETRPAETRPAETRPAETRPAETRRAETRPAEARDELAIPEFEPQDNPELLHWRRLVTLHADMAATGERYANDWLRARTRSRRERGVLQIRRPLSPVSPSSPQGKPIDQARGPTLRRIHELAGRVSDKIRPLLLKIAERFHEPGPERLVHRIMREIGATDWHGKIFRLELGLTPNDLVLELRVEVALWLLRETSLPVEGIARLVGYRSQRSLQLLFKNACGFTPSKARAHLRLVAEELRPLGDELLSWYFWVRYHLDEIETEEYLRAVTYLDRRFFRS